MRRLLPLALVIVAGAALPASAAPPPGWTEWSDPARGVMAELPPGWHAAPKVTALGYPQEVATLASFAFEPGGACGPDAARRLPRDGALIFITEYRPARGAVWRDSIRRSSFPLRPDHLTLRGKAEAFECFASPARQLRFRDADRPLQVMIALGRQATAARRRQVEQVLDALHFDPLPPTPPDPYAGWPEVVDESGSTMRVPTGWTRHAISDHRVAPPRTVFVTANAPLGGNGARLRSVGDTHGLATFPSRGVALFVTEAARGGTDAAFPPFPAGRPWPQDSDFVPVRGGLAARVPHLSWQRAGVGFRRHRFAVWLAAGPLASPADLALARQATASLALSGP